MKEILQGLSLVIVKKKLPIQFGENI